MEALNKTERYNHNVDLVSEAMVITILDETNQPRKIDLRTFNKNVVTFGRGEDNDIIINSSIVSRKHGCFFIHNENCTIEDSGSMNGLIYKGEIIKSHILQNGDEVRIDSESEPTSRGVLFIFSQNEEDDDWNTFPLSGIGTVLIGRDSSCHIRLNHISVSKIHAKIVKSGSDFYIYDNKSTNSIIINGKKVEGSRKLREKDLIVITNSKLIFTEKSIAYCSSASGIKIDAYNISKVVQNKGEEKIICNEITLTINPCELVAVIGGSGTGKTTVMNCLSGYSSPTSGQVLVNGIDLYENFESFKNIIGYVPQSDIVYDNLTVSDMLKYTAKLRLPSDASEEEQKYVIENATDMVELTAHKNTLIRELSGGQRKRASIAVELLSNPNLFFLDEPVSGLDPDTECNLMSTLKNMALSGKTVVLVTHSTLNLSMCDKIIFMGKGGNLCFCGSYDESLKFFNESDIVKIYNMIAEDIDKWKEKFKAEHFLGSVKKTISDKRVFKAKSKEDILKHLVILSKRYIHLLFNDRRRLALIL